MRGNCRKPGDFHMEMIKRGAAAQDEATSVVYGMPKAAVESGGVQQVASLPRMATIISRRFK